MLLAEQGNGQQRAVARGGNEIAHGARVRAHGDVGDLHGLAARRRPTEDTLGLGDGLLTDNVPGRPGRNHRSLGAGEHSSAVSS